MGIDQTMFCNDREQGKSGQKLIRRISQCRIGQPDDLDGIILLLSDENRAGLITGSVYTVDGGQVVQSL